MNEKGYASRAVCSAELEAVPLVAGTRVVSGLAACRQRLPVSGEVRTRCARVEDIHFWTRRLPHWSEILSVLALLNAGVKRAKYRDSVRRNEFNT